MALLAFVVTLQAQNSNAVFFSENGERFYIVLNGLRMNDVAATNVKVTDLNQPAYKAKIIFENTDLGEMDKSIYFNDPGYEIVYVIKKNKKGDYKLGYQSAVPIAQAPPAPAAQSVIVFGAPAPAPVVVAPAPTAVVVEETITTTTTTGGGSVNQGTGENINMSVDMGGFGMNVNVNTNDAGMNTSTNSSMTTTTTTTTTTSNTNMGMNDQVIIVEEPAPCPAMNSAEFSDACGSIRSKSFSDSKMTLAKQIVKGHCVNSVQVRDMAKLFSFEDDRLEFAKFAYPYTVDQNHYYKVNDAFTFESTIEELDEYIHGR